MFLDQLLNLIQPQFLLYTEQYKLCSGRLQGKKLHVNELQRASKILLFQHDVVVAHQQLLPEQLSEGVPEEETPFVCRPRRKRCYSFLLEKL